MVSFKANGCYLVTFSVKVENRVGLVLAGNGATLHRKSAIATTVGRTNKAILFLGFSKYVTVRDMKLKGDNTQPERNGPGNYYDFKEEREHDHGLFIYGGSSPHGSSNILVTSVKTDNLFGDSMRLWGTNNARIEKSLIYGAGRQGIVVRAADRVAMVDNRFEYIRQTAIDFEENPVTNVRI